MVNKNQFRKVNDKKLLRKKGKRWITVSVGLLAALGINAAFSSATHADTTATSGTTTQQLPSNSGSADSASSKTASQNSNNNQTASSNTQRSATNNTNTTAQSNNQQSSGSAVSNSLNKYFQNNGSNQSSGSDTQTNITAQAKALHSNILATNAVHTQSASSNNQSGARQSTSEQSGAQQMSLFSNKYTLGMSKSNSISDNQSSNNGKDNNQTANKIMNAPKTHFGSDGSSANASYSDGTLLLSGDLSNINNQGSDQNGGQFGNSDISNNWNNITTIKFTSDTKLPANSSYLFQGMSHLNKVTASDNVHVDTSNVTNMNGMFASDSGLNDIQSLAKWDTSNVSDMGDMFNGDKSLSNIQPLAHWNLTDASSTSEMFASDTSLTNLNPLANWNTSDITNMSGMFAGDSNLSNLNPLANWKTDGVSDMGSMFSRDSNLSNLQPLTHWNTGSVTELGSMFESDGNLSSLQPLANWNTSSASDMSNMFYGDTNLINKSGNQLGITPNNSRFSINSTNVPKVNQWNIDGNGSVSNGKQAGQNYVSQDTISYMYKGNQMSITMMSGDGNATANGVNMPAGYKLADDGTQNFTFNGQIHNVNIKPIQVTDTINYSDGNGHNEGTKQFTGNSVQAQGASDTNFTIDGSNHAGLNKYWTVPASNQFNFDGGTYTVTVVHGTIGAQINYKNNGKTIGSFLYANGKGPDATPRIITHNAKGDIDSHVPANYHVADNTDNYTYQGNNGNTNVINVNVAPNQETVAINYHDIDNNGVISGNNVDYSKNINVPYGTNISDVTKSVNIPNGYHYVNGNKSYTVNGNNVQVVNLNVAGNLQSGTVNVTINKKDGGVIKSSYTRSINVYGATGTPYTVDPNDSSLKPAGYNAQSGSVTGQFTNGGITKNSASFDYDVSAGSAIKVQYKNQNGQILNTDGSVNNNPSADTGSITGNVDDTGSIASKVALPQGYAPNAGQPNTYHITADPQAPIVINVSGDKASTLGDNGKSIIYIEKKVNGKVVSDNPVTVDNGNKEVGDNFTINPASYTPAGYTSTSQAINGTVNPTGLSTDSNSKDQMTFVYNANSGSTVNVSYKNQNGQTIENGSINGDIDSTGNVYSQNNLAMPDGYHFVSASDNGNNINGANGTDVNYKIGASSQNIVINVAGDDHNPSTPIPNQPGDSSNGKAGSGQSDISNPNPGQPISNVTPNSGSFNPANPQDANDTFYIGINKYSNGKFVGSYAKRFTVSGKTGDSFRFDPSEFVPSNYSADSGDQTVNGTINANGLSAQSAVFNYNANKVNDTIKYTLSGNDIPNGYQGQTGSVKSDVSTGYDDSSVDNNDLNSNVPNGYHIVNTPNLDYDSGTHSVEIAPNQETVNVKYHDNDNNGVVTENNQPDISRNITVPYDTKVNVADAYNLPNGYHLAGGQDSNYTANGNSAQSVTLNIDGDNQNGTVNVVINKSSGGNPVGSSTKHINVHGATGTSFDINPNNYTPNGYHNQSNTFTGQFVPGGISNNSKNVTFDYDSQDGTAIGVKYVNQNGKVLNENGNINGDQNASTGVINGRVDDNGDIDSKVGVPNGYTVDNGQPSTYHITTSQQSPIVIHVTGKSAADLADQGKATVYIEKRSNGDTVSTDPVSVDLSGKKVGDGYTINPSAYTPNGYTSASQVINGVVTPNGLSTDGNSKQQMTFVYNAKSNSVIHVNYVNQRGDSVYNKTLNGVVDEKGTVNSLPDVSQLKDYQLAGDVDYTFGANPRTITVHLDAAFAGNVNGSKNYHVNVSNVKPSDVPNDPKAALKPSDPNNSSNQGNVNNSKHGYVTVYLVRQSKGKNQSVDVETVNENNLKIGDNYDIKASTYTPSGYTVNSNDHDLTGHVNNDGGLSSGVATFYYEATGNKPNKPNKPNNNGGNVTPNKPNNKPSNNGGNTPSNNNNIPNNSNNGNNGGNNGGNVTPNNPSNNNVPSNNGNNVNPSNINIPNIPNIPNNVPINNGGTNINIPNVPSNNVNNNVIPNVNIPVPHIPVPNNVSPNVVPGNINNANAYNAYLRNLRYQGMLNGERTALNRNGIPFPAGWNNAPRDVNNIPGNVPANMPGVRNNSDNNPADSSDGLDGATINNASDNNQSSKDSNVADYVNPGADREAYSAGYLDGLHGNPNAYKNYRGVSQIIYGKGYHAGEIQRTRFGSSNRAEPNNSVRVSNNNAVTANNGTDASSGSVNSGNGGQSSTQQSGKLPQTGEQPGSIAAAAIAAAMGGLGLAGADLDRKRRSKKNK